MLQGVAPILQGVTPRLQGVTPTYHCVTLIVIVLSIKIEWVVGWVVVLCRD